MEVKATEKYIRISPKKARPIADIVRGQKANEAIVMLNFTNKKGAKVISKALKSAVANAEHNHSLNTEELVIKKISVDNGPHLKRFRPRSRGMVSHILKRTSHITVVVSDEASLVAKNSKVNMKSQKPPKELKTVTGEAVKAEITNGTKRVQPKPKKQEKK